ncbi:molybdate ABC transporter substrate-binding protein [Thalassospira australica]|uniref:molybdate ABC transporter substrate-binding protein n=1 Tax=Thalassospira australica TaxID=1528106 RepID=UPI000519F392|nr:molybdate ABC transporter substrate-binding protein [Thalassospira australica]
MLNHLRSPLNAFICLLTVLVMLGGAPSPAKADDITVFAAASMTNAIQTAAKVYEEKTGDRVRLSLASSSTLARQIAAGAPADIFISANEKWMIWLEDQGLIATTSRYHLLANRLVLIAPKNSPLSRVHIDQTTDLMNMAGPNEYIAVGDPDHVPAGIYAKQALITLGQWDGVKQQLARTDNVRAALALVERGEAPVGIVYRTDADISDQVKIIASFPENSHPAITYPIALTSDHAKPGALKLLLWLLGDDAGRIFADYGFEPIATTKATVSRQ